MSHAFGDCRAHSAADVQDRAARIATGLGEAGVAKGDRVVLLLPNSVDLVAVVWACLTTGRIPVPLDPRLTSFEREPILREVDATLVVDSLTRVTDLAQHSPSRLDPVPTCRPMHFTSGTTGRPKGVWSSFWDEPTAKAAMLDERELWGFCPSDVNLAVSPLYHSAPLRFAIGTLLAGGSIAVLPAFTAEGFCEAVDSVRPTTMFCVPTQLQRLFSHLESAPAPDVSCFRLVAHARAPCPEPIRIAAHAFFGTETVWEFYGSTEGQFTACSAVESIAHPGTVGRARKGRTIDVADDGELWCTVPPWGRFSYWGDPAKTAAVWRETERGPAFTVGDLGQIDADGFVYLTARRTDLIITGGVNVYPAEVEAALADVPGVVEVAVHARPDEKWGQRVCASFVGTASEADLRNRAIERLAAAKRPKVYFRVAELPRTGTGKVRRTEL